MFLKTPDFTKTCYSTNHKTFCLEKLSLHYCKTFRKKFLRISNREQKPGNGT